MDSRQVNNKLLDFIYEDLQEKGYKLLSYTNNVEDKLSTSYVLVDPKAAKSYFGEKNKKLPKDSIKKAYNNDKGWYDYDEQGRKTFRDAPVENIQEDTTLDEIVNELFNGDL
jgi:hypothetical protein